MVEFVLTTSMMIGLWLGFIAVVLVELLIVAACVAAWFYLQRARNAVDMAHGFVLTVSQGSIKRPIESINAVLHNTQAGSQWMANRAPWWFKALWTVIRVSSQRMSEAPVSISSSINA